MIQPGKFKEIGFLFLFFYFNFNSIFSQDCLPQGTVFYKQSELDEFFALNSDCKVIEGDLVIGGYTTPITKNKDIINLDAFKNIEEIKGSLIISGLENILNLKSFTKLNKIGNNLIIQGNTKIINLTGLEKITRIEGNLELFVNNVAKMSTVGLNNVTVIKGNLNLKSFGTGSLAGLSKIDTIYGSIDVWGDGVSNFSDLKALKFIGKNISIYDSEISSFAGLSNIKEIYGNLSISDNNVGFSGLSNVEVIHGNFKVDQSAVNFSTLNKLKEVKGDLYLYEIGATEIKNLTALERIGGDLSLIHSNLIGTPLAGMPKLKFIGGDLYFYENDLLNDYAEWPTLDTIMGNLSFTYHYSLTGVSGFNKLKYIGGDLKIDNNKELISINGFSSINTIHGSISILSNAKLKTVTKLYSVSNIHGLTIQSNPLLEEIIINSTNESMNNSISINSNAKLKKVQGFGAVKKMNSLNITSNGSLTEINLCPDLKVMKGSLILEYNNVSTINKFESLDSIINGISLAQLNKANITFNEFLPSLKYLDGSLKLVQVTVNDLNILAGKTKINGSLELQYVSGLNSLNVLSDIDSVKGNLVLALAIKTLKPLSNLKHINGYFNISNCDSLQSLEGLEKLNYIKSFFFLTSNDKLDNIEALNNLDPKNVNPNGSVTTFNMTNNPKLNDCEIKFLCKLLDLKGPTKTNISNNGIGCSSANSIECLDSTMLAGKTYLDLNFNDTLDVTDVLMPLIKISINENDTVQIISNQRGRYFFTADENREYQIKVIEQDNLEMATSPIVRTFHKTDVGNKEVHIPIKFVKDTIKGIAFIPGPKVNRCSEVIKFEPHVSNTGTQTTSYKLKMYKGIYTLQNSYPSPKYLTDGYEWQFDNGPVFSEKTISLDLKMPNFTFTGIDMDIPMTLHAYIDGAWVKIDSSSYTSTIVCSYDPNDKQVEPIGKKDQKFVLIKDALNYTIRFQNTGNAPAKDVVIIDTLDEQLDLTTFQMIASSHTLNVSLDRNVVSFFFRNIWLPDSISNKEKSQGYLLFSIKPKADIQELSLVENKADIYFDYNPAVTTNTVSNTLVSYICDDEIINIDTTVCKGASVLGHTTTGKHSVYLYKGVTCDTILKLNLKIENPKTEFRQYYACVGSLIELSQLQFIMPASTQYILDTIRNGECIDSVVTHYIYAVKAKRIPLDTIICQGQSAYGFTEAGTYLIPIENNNTICTDTLELKLNFFPFNYPPCIMNSTNEIYSRVDIIPNPASQWFQINTNKQIQSLKGYNAQGQEVNIIKLNSNRYKIEGTGLYFLSIKFEDGNTVTKKIIIQE